MPQISTESALGGDAPANQATGLTVAMNGTLHGRIGTVGDHDFVGVDLVAGRTYTFAMVGIGAGMVTDTFLELRGPDGATLLASDDDGLQNRNSVITYTATQSGRFFLDASAFSGKTGDYGLAATEGTKAHFDADMIGGIIDTHYTWAAARGTGTNITFGFRDTYAGTNPGFSQFTEAEKAATRAVLAHYAELTGLTFTEVNPGGYTDAATLLYANYSANDGAGAFGSYPGSRADAASAGDVWVNDDAPITVDSGVGSYFRSLMMHEIGHTMGLSHPGKYNAALGVSITYAGNAQFLEDSSQYSLMSYFDASETGGPSATADTLALFDVMALQLMYGANMTTRTGDTIYGFGSNAGDTYDFARNVDPVLTIWDAGGRDMINASRYSTNQLIDLREGGFSDIGGMTHNVAIAFGATIERATGGRGHDVLEGNAADNGLSGGDGDDRLNGDAGNDTLQGGHGGDTLRGGAGNDLLQGAVPGVVAASPEVFDLVATDKSAGASLKLNGADLFPTGSFTVELIWKQNALVDEHYSLDIGNFSFYRYNDGTVSLMFWGAASQAWNYGAIPATMTDGAAHRISVSYDDATGVARVYLDGSETWSRTFTPGTRAMTAVGNVVLDDDASIGDVRIFDHARTAAEIWDNAWISLPDPAGEAGLVQNWAGDGAGHLVSVLAGKPDLASTGPTAADQAATWTQGTVDVMEGGTGNDTYIVQATTDQVVDLAGEGRDTVVTHSDYTLGAGSETEVLRVATGATGGFRLAGNQGANAIYGGGGADSLQGGGGADRLYGGAGPAADRFVYADASDSNRIAGMDRIYGFVSGVDVIDLSGIDADVATGGDQAFAAFGATAVAHSVWAVLSGANLVLRGDVTGDRQADFEVMCMNIGSLNAADLIL